MSRKRVRQRNDQDIELTKTSCTAPGNVVLSANRAVENDGNKVASQEAEDVIGEEIEKNEKQNTV